MGELGLSAGQALLFGVVAIGLVLGLGLGGKMLLYGVGFVLLAAGGLIGIVLYGDAMVVAVVGVVGILGIAYTVTHLPLGSTVTHHHYSVGRDGEIHHTERKD